MVMWCYQLELHFIELSHFGAIFEAGELGENLFYFQRVGRTRNYFKGSQEAVFLFQVILRCPDFFRAGFYRKYCLPNLIFSVIFAIMQCTRHLSNHAYPRASDHCLYLLSSRDFLEEK